MRKKTTPVLVLITLYSINIAGVVSRLIAVLLASFAELYPDVPITTVNLLYTLPNITTTVVSLLMGPIVGKKIGFKPVFVVGLSSYVVFGVLPYFIPDKLTVILILRFLIGISAGLMGFCLAAIMSTFGAEKGGTYLSLANAVCSVGTLALTAVIGQIALQKAENYYLLFLTAIIPLLLVIFTYHDEPQETAPGPDEPEKEGGLIKDVLPAFPYIAALFAFYLLNTTMTLNMSSIAASNNYSVTFSSMLFSAQTVGAIIAGAVFGFYNKLTKRFCMPVTFALLGISGILMVTCKGQILYLLSYLLFGMASTWIYPLTVSYGAATVKHASIAFMTSLFSVATTIAFFLGNYWLTFAGIVFGKGEMVYAPIMATAAVSFIICAALMIINPVPKALSSAARG